MERSGIIIALMRRCDADGGGHGVTVQFATLTNKPQRTVNDFLVVA